MCGTDDSMGTQKWCHTGDRHLDENFTKKRSNRSKKSPFECFFMKFSSNPSRKIFLSNVGKDLIHGTQSCGCDATGRYPILRLFLRSKCKKHIEMHEM
jgi:hypothetical protein